MTIQRKIANWRRISQFCARRVTDYGQLIPIELAETKTRVLHEVIASDCTGRARDRRAFHALVRIDCRDRHCRRYPVSRADRLVRGGRMARHLGDAVIVMMSRRPAEPFQMLRDQLRRDMDAIREVAQ